MAFKRPGSTVGGTSVLTRAVLALASIVAAIGFTTVATAAPAAAAGPCGSSYAQVGHYPIKSSSFGTVGYIDVYWSSTTQRNCAVMDSVGVSRGFARYKMALIYPSSSPREADIDAGDFKYYAGPVYTPRGYNMSGECITVKGAVKMPDGSAPDRQLSNVHCG
ncbi:hypothetical protein [Salininema proteolyticum]|uniref:Spore-associated protein A n=1 Tax=Salininema proteolyticum TaxID=1607685 RepID=A0ABV8U589_9ACTN